jgi:hypothetical protein
MSMHDDVRNTTDRQLYTANQSQAEGLRRGLGETVWQKRQIMRQIAWQQHATRLVARRLQFCFAPVRCRGPRGQPGLLVPIIDSLLQCSPSVMNAVVRVWTAATMTEGESRTTLAASLSSVRGSGVLCLAHCHPDRNSGPEAFSNGICCNGPETSSAHPEYFF